MVVLFFLILGLFIGSFLNVLVDRLPNGKNPLVGRSHCDYCKKVLAWNDLIPVVSFISTKGRCKYCKHKLSVFYPIVEISTGLLFIITYLFYMGNAVGLVFSLFIVSVMIVIFFADLKYGIIPDLIVFPAIIISLIFLVLNNKPVIGEFILNPVSVHGNPSSLPFYLLSAVMCFLLFLFLFVATKGRAMGFGDVKFAFLLGLVLGPFPTIIMLYVAFLTGAIVGLILILWKKKGMKHAIPFGPFLVEGFLISYFLGPQITHLILGII